MLRAPPLSSADEALERAEARIRSRQNLKLGMAPSKVEVPAFRVPWVCRRIFGVNGANVDYSDKWHPCRTVGVDAYLSMGVEEASGCSDDELIVDFRTE